MEFLRKYLKVSIVIKNVNWFENTLIHKAERFSNYFTAVLHIIRPSRYSKE